MDPKYFFSSGWKNIVSSASICKTSLWHNGLKWGEAVLGEYIASCFQKHLKHLLFPPIKDHHRSCTSDLSGCATLIAVTWLVNSSLNHQMCLTGIQIRLHVWLESILIRIFWAPTWSALIPLHTAPLLSVYLDNCWDFLLPANGCCCCASAVEFKILWISIRASPPCLAAHSSCSL